MTAHARSCIRPNLPDRCGDAPLPVVQRQMNPVAFGTATEVMDVIIISLFAVLSQVANRQPPPPHHRVLAAVQGRSEVEERD